MITTDQGTEFRNSLNTELMKVFRIDHRLTTAYHPQANGLDERFNQTLVNSLNLLKMIEPVGMKHLMMWFMLTIHQYRYYGNLYTIVVLSSRC